MMFCDCMFPPHTCYVEVWPSSYQRIFRKPQSRVEVYNDQGETAQLFRMLREQPETLLGALTSAAVGKTSPEVSCYHRLMAAWHLSQQTSGVPTTIDALEATLLAPYQRLRTVLFEDLDWRACLERYNDPRALFILEPPWKITSRDEWAALRLRLARSHMQWRLVIPSDIFACLRFPGSSPIAHEGDTICLAPCP